MSVYRSMIRHTATYSVAVIAGRISSIILLPVYTHLLTPADYGLLDILELVNQVFTLLLGANLGNAVAYFHEKGRTPEDRAASGYTAILGAHGIALLAATGGWFVAPALARGLFSNPAFAIHCRVMMVTLALGLAQEMGLALLRVQNRSAVYVRIMLCRMLLVVGVNVTLLAAFHMGALGMLVGSMSATAATLAYLDWIHLRDGGWSFRPGLFWQQFRYAFPVGLSSLGMTFLHSGDRFFLQRYVSLFDVGLYGMAYRFGTLAGYVQPVFETYWNAQVFSIVKGESGERHYARTLTYFAFVSAAVAVAVSLFSQPMVRVMTPPAYHGAVLLSPLIAVCYAWRGVGDYFRSTFALHRKTERNVVVTAAGAILALITYSLLIPRFHLWGAAIATVISFIGMSVVSYYQAQRVKEYQFEWTRLWKIVGCAVVVILPYPLLGGMHIYLQFLVSGLLTLLYPVLLWLAGFFEAEELQQLRNYALIALNRARSAAVRRVGAQ